MSMRRSVVGFLCGGALGLALLVAPGVAGAKPLGQVCSALIGSQVTQCLGAARGQYIDPNAADVCSQLIGSQVVSCIGTIAGKAYTPDETGACGGLIGSQVIECLGQAGRIYVARPVPPPPPPPPVYQPPPPPGMGRQFCGPMSLAEVRSEIAAALELMRGGDPGAADRRLKGLLHQLR